MDIGILRRDGRTDGFFDAAARDRLAVRRCAGCDAFFPPDATSCPGCGTEDLEWADVSGDATLVTWTILHGRPAEDGTAPPPALLAIVELAEGPWLHARLDGVDAADLREGLALRVRFVHPEEGEPYPLFAPA
ncbi:Zn-ribbon domain-containing OB-fold protein [Actinomadura gamaensis]|uniref:Zn-ribbon domain-containing OB-fold protein n=1 Tax=Actinomadura gamaensis TaxID=1763541 RepID=A0ABV9TX59_9ACTN